MRGAEKLKDEIMEACNARLSGELVIISRILTKSSMTEKLNQIWLADYLIRFKYDPEEWFLTASGR